MKNDKIDYTNYEMEYSILPRMYYEYEESDSFLNQILEDELILKIYEKWFMRMMVLRRKWIIKSIRPMSLKSGQYAV